MQRPLPDVLELGAASLPDVQRPCAASLPRVMELGAAYLPDVPRLIASPYGLGACVRLYYIYI